MYNIETLKTKLDRAERERETERERESCII